MQNNLESLFRECYIHDHLKPHNNVKLNFDFLQVFNQRGLHDAGFDSLITGTALICMTNVL